VVPKNDMKVRMRKRGDWSGKSESGFYAVIHSLRAPLPPTVVLKNDMKVRRKKRGDWSGKSESGFYAVIHSLRAPLPPTGRMNRTRMMESLFLRTKKSKLDWKDVFQWFLLYV